MWTTVFSLANKLARTRPYQAAWFVVLCSAAVLAFVPLFNLVGYESAAFFGVLLGVLSTGLTIYAVQSGEVKAPLSKSRKRSPARDFGRLALRHLMLAVVPLVMLVVNGWRVINCDWAAGFGFWLLIPVVSILLGQAAAWVALSLVGDRKVLPWLVAFLFPLSDALALLAHLAWEPPIVGHQWFLGYFGGSIYDEALAIPLSLIVYRTLHLLAILVVVAAIEATFALRRGRMPGWTIALVVVGSLALGWGFSNRMDYGISVDRDRIIEELRGSVETEHFIIYFSESASSMARLDELVDDHEFRYHQMREFFGTDPVASSGRKLRSFVYPNRDMKGRLMGGRVTMVAKMWLQEMHILWRGPGDHMLAHELAHLFTEPFGAGPLRLSMKRPLGVNMGLVEGVAAAAEWSAQELTPHEATAAMRTLEMAPDLRRLFGAGGFWTQASGRAYTAMGSFVRFLVDHYGMERFKRAYSYGAFEAEYGIGVDDLIARWEGYLDQIVLTERQLEVARYRYDRRSIFAKPCARSRAEQRRLARDAASRGALGVARRCYEEIVAEEPEDTQIILEYASVLGRLKLHGKALDLVRASQDSSRARVERAHLLDKEGDLLWLKGEAEQAVVAYEEALTLGVPLDRERSLIIKSRLAGEDDRRGREYLLTNPGTARAIYSLSRWRQESPQDPVAAYLLGRRLWQSKLYRGAVEHLQLASGRLGSEVLDGEAKQMLGQSYYFDGRFSEARQTFEELATSEITRYREGSRQWLVRLDWVERNRH